MYLGTEDYLLRFFYRNLIITPNQRFILYLRLEGDRTHISLESCAMTHSMGYSRETHF